MEHRGMLREEGPPLKVVAAVDTVATFATTAVVAANLE